LCRFKPLASIDAEQAKERRNEIASEANFMLMEGASKFGKKVMRLLDY